MLSYLQKSIKSLLSFLLKGKNFFNDKITTRKKEIISFRFF